MNIPAYLRNIHITQFDSCNASSSVEVVHGEVNNHGYNLEPWTHKFTRCEIKLQIFLPTKFNTLTNVPFCQTTKILPTKFNTHTVALCTQISSLLRTVNILKEEYGTISVAIL